MKGLEVHKQIHILESIYLNKQEIIKLLLMLVLKVKVGIMDMQQY